MEIHAYDKYYLPYVSESIGCMFENSINIGLNPEIFWLTFINSNVAKQIEKGNPKYLSYSSFDYLTEIYEGKKMIKQKGKINKNLYFWAGWILTQFQYLTGFSFDRINSYLPIQRVLELYPTLHEADVSKFFEIAKAYFYEKNKETNLKKIRLARGLSQSELALKAEVDIRSIQMYEQRHNDINKAQAETLRRLSIVLGCNMEDLLEITLS